MSKQEIIRIFCDMELAKDELMERAENQEDAGMALAFITRNEAEQAEQDLHRYVVDNGIYFSKEYPPIRVRD